MCVKVYSQSHIRLCGPVFSVAQVQFTLTVFTRIICALFSSLAAEKSGCVKYVDFFLRRS
jgi:hypothetical protein